MFGNANTTQGDSSEDYARGEDQGRDQPRRWYHPHPQPRRAVDMAGINYTYWLLVLAVLMLVFIP
jgi:hypothetical protein